MNRMLNMLGLCMRAGKIISGEKACIQATRMGAAITDPSMAERIIQLGKAEF